jgi:hypothetical protein
MRRSTKLTEKERIYFRDLVKKAGGNKKAAKVMDCLAQTVSHHSGGKAALSLARVRKLERHLGVKDGPATVGDQGRHEFLPLADLEEKVESLRWAEDEDGFQRNLSEIRVAEIESELRDGNGKFPPIMIGEMPGGRWIEIDGQHRRAGHLAARLPCHAWIVQVESIEEARQLYLLYNGKERPIVFQDRYEASRNPLRMKMKAWEAAYDAETKQVAAVVRGLVGNKAMDFVDPKHDLEPAMVKRAELVLKTWSSDSRWMTDKAKPSVYATPKVLTALGKISKDYSLSNLRKALRICQANKKTYWKSGSWAKICREKKQSDLVNAMRAYITPRLNDGITGRNGNRA